MKKILFIVCTHGDELAGMELFYEFPYGKNDQVEWRVVIGNPEAMMLNSRMFEEDLNRVASLPGTTYERLRARQLEKLMQGYDVVYDIHTTIRIKEEIGDSIFVNTLDSVPDTKFAAATHIIFDSKDNHNYVTSLHPNGITLEYTKTASVQADRVRVVADFQRIVLQQEWLSEKVLSEFEILVTQPVAAQHNFNWQDFTPISEADREKLALPTGKYLPVFVNPPEVDQKVYAALNRCL